MKLKLASIAVTAALSTLAGSALAALPGDVTTVPANQVRLSGATAQNGGIDNVVRIFCGTNTVDAYANAKQVAYVCNAAAGTALTTAGFPAGTSIAIHKESSGGSGNGIAPVRDSTTLAFVDLAAISATPGLCSLDTVSSVAAATVGGVTLAAKNVWNCTTATTTAVPDIGFSDVDPAVFGQASTGLNVLSPNELVFGVPVTTALRNALQNAQATSGRIPASCNGTASDAVVCTPTLSEPEVAGIYTGRLATFGKLVNSADTTPIYLLRRGSTSGTQKTAEVVFLNANITTQANFTNNFKAPSAAFNSVLASDAGCGNSSASTVPAPAASTVFAGSANEEVVNCFNRHNSGGRYAAGILTTEFNQFANPASSSAAIDTTFPTGFRFIKVGGALPTVANVIRGDYNFFSEQVITSRTGTSGTPAQVVSAMNSELGNATNVTIINSSFTSWSDAPVGEKTSGLLKPGASASCKATFASLGTTPDSDPVNNATKNPSGAKTANAIKPALAVCPSRF